MSEIAEQYAVGEHETHRAVQLSSQIQIFDMIKRSQDEISSVAKALREHMDQEAKDRQVFIKELQDIRLDIQKLDAKIDSVSFGADSRIDNCKSELRRDVNKETDANIHSLKVELKAEIARVAHQLERFSDHMKQEHKDADAKFVRVFERLEAVERNQAANNQWVDMGKKVAYTIAGALAIGLLYAMGLQLK